MTTTAAQLIQALSDFQRHIFAAHPDRILAIINGYDGTFDPCPQCESHQAELRSCAR